MSFQQEEKGLLSVMPFSYKRLFNKFQKRSFIKTRGRIPPNAFGKEYPPSRRKMQLAFLYKLALAYNNGGPGDEDRLLVLINVARLQRENV
jgi:hypothetical protein